MEPNDLQIENSLPKHLNDLATRVIGAAIEVHRQLGPGYLESVYQKALELELELEEIAYQRECPCRITYKNRELCTVFFDLVVQGELLLELKAVESVSTLHLAQTRSYMRAGAFQLALVINFNVGLLKNGIRRIIMTDH